MPTDSTTESEGMRKDRILMLHPQVELYGADRMFVESVAALVIQGHHVIVALPTHGPLVAELEQLNIPICFLPTPILRKSAVSPLGLVRLAMATASALRPTIRLFRSYSPSAVYISTLTAPLWTIIGRMMRIPVLVHVHEAEESVPRVVRLALAAPLLAARSVIVNSRRTADVLCRDVPRLRERIRLIYNGVRHPSDLKGPPQHLDEIIRILTVGRLSPRKGTDVAIAAVAELRRRGWQIHLSLVGQVFTGYEWYESMLRNMVVSSKLQDCVTFEGFCADVWPHYRRADVAMVPSRWEPFGNTAVEAQLAGVPVVVTNRQGLPETVADGAYGSIVDADDPVALADGVEELLRDWPSAIQRARAAKVVASSKFSIERYRADVAAAVKAVLLTGRRGTDESEAV